MGCDIHLHIEKRNEAGTWEKVPDPLRECWGCRGTGRYVDDGHTTDEYVGEICMWCEGVGKRTEEFYEGRNYNLFAILANVRNARGFSGVVTGEGFNVIAESRGLPADVSAYVRRGKAGWGVDGHSHTWLTIAELLAFDWNQTTQQWGWVKAEAYKTFKERGKPEIWSVFVSGGSVRHVTHKEMEKLIAVRDTEYVYTRVNWVEPYSESVGKFLTETLPEMVSLGNPDDVRMVFWFDN